MKSKDMNTESVKQVIQSLYDQGDRVIVASKAFGVDNMTEEKMVAEIAESMGLPASMASDITKLYGLTTRTRTAALNASIFRR